MSNDRIAVVGTNIQETALKLFPVTDYLNIGIALLLKPCYN